MVGKHFKEKVYWAFYQQLTEKAGYLQKELLGLSESAKNETKSTVGDKHETALAMLQIEQENIRTQLHHTNEQLLLFKMISPLIKNQSVQLGSLVKAGTNWFFMSAGVGKIKIDNEIIVSLSPLSPLGNQLKGRQQNETIEINGKAFIIEAIY